MKRPNVKEVLPTSHVRLYQICYFEMSLTPSHVGGSSFFVALIIAQFIDGLQGYVDKGLS